ncbi:MAG: aminoglycoside phosphotransferase family protein [Chloroflexota bacterium]|nr:aminoglycoside phosphotransferase family protein [Chloroflexota bacterium]MDE2961329.1 aminoglycoside phosphotransferase family protein [Chloroflexota bacterium]
MAFALSESNAVGYLLGEGLISPRQAGSASARELGGGVSNIVVRVDFPDTSDNVVIKQSLPRLRVEQEWLADQARIHREAAALRYLDGALPSSALPSVVHEDPNHFLFVMTAAEQPRTWKDDLLSGLIDTRVATEVGRLLAAMHQHSAVAGEAMPPELREFADQRCFVQLRIDPYHRATALAHPDLSDEIAAEAQAMLDCRLCLVHGDYSPKNVIVSPTDRGPAAFLLDFEVVHLGNPVFDLAFMLNHLTLKAIHRPDLASQFNEAGIAFWSVYCSNAETFAAEPMQLQFQTIRQLGVLLLARIDGKSPAEYITTDAQRSAARHLARTILAEEIRSISDLHQALLS